MEKTMSSRDIFLFRQGIRSYQATNKFLAIIRFIDANKKIIINKPEENLNSFFQKIDLHLIPPNQVEEAMFHLTGLKQPFTPCLKTSPVPVVSRRMCMTSKTRKSSESLQIWMAVLRPVYWGLASNIKLEQKASRSLGKIEMIILWYWG